MAATADSRQSVVTGTSRSSGRYQSNLSDIDNEAD